MRALLILCGLAATISSPVLARKNAGGALVVHTAQYGYDLNQPCTTEYDDPGTCENAQTQTDEPLDRPALVWVIAAFPDLSDPGVVVVYFGLDHNMPLGEGYFDRWGFCGPPGSIEVPDPGWPDDTNAGNSIGFGSPVTGNRLFPVYWFLVYGFEGAYLGTGINPTGGYAAFVSDDNPGVLDECFRFGQVRWYEPGFNECPEAPIFGACCFETGACEVLAPEECIVQGGEFLGDGTDCDPNPCPQIPGGCCFVDGHCEIFSGVDCEHYAGTWLGPNTLCDPNPCDQPFEACCFTNGSCSLLPPAQCEQAGGTPQGAGTTCDQVGCKAPSMGACCLEDDSCRVTLEPECAVLAGVWNAGVACEPNPCGTVTETTTWGRIKAGYR